MKTQHYNIRVLAFVLSETSKHKEQDPFTTYLQNNKKTRQSQSNSYTEVFLNFHL